MFYTKWKNLEAVVMIFFLSCPQVVMLVVVSGLVQLTSSFIQGRVYRDTDAPNMTRCRTWCIVSTDTDPGWSPTLFEEVCNFNVQSGLLSDQHGTTSLTWLSNHGVIMVKCLTQEHNTLETAGLEPATLWLRDCTLVHCATDENAGQVVKACLEDNIKGIKSRNSIYNSSSVQEECCMYRSFQT